MNRLEQLNRRLEEVSTAHAELMDLLAPLLLAAAPAEAPLLLARLERLHAAQGLAWLAKCEIIGNGTLTASGEAVMVMQFAPEGEDL